MKIAIVSSSYHPYYKGGGEYSVRNLTESLVQRGEEVIVITAYHQEAKEDINGVKVFRVKHPNIYWSFESDNQPSYRKLIWHALEGYNVRVENRVKDILLQEQPDVLHVRNAEDFSYVCKVAKKSGIPVVVTTNSCTWLCPKGTMSRNGKNCVRQCISCKVITYPKKQLSRYVDAVVGVSRFMTDLHEQYNYFPSASRQVIYTATNPKFNDLPVLKNNYLTFGYIGRIHPIKGVTELIRAFCKLPQPDIKLLIAGDGPYDYYQQCQKLAEHDHRIVFLGKVNPESFYKQTDIVIISSLVHEAFPRVLVEAYAYSRPVIASDTGGTPEMIITEKTGYIFDPYSTAQLLQAMQRIISLDKKALLKMQKNIEHLVSERFRDDVQQYLEVYRSVQP